MKAPKLPFRDLLLSAGLISLLIAPLASAAPARSRNSSVATSSQAASTFKTYQSKLGFQIDFPSTYTVDASQEGQGSVVLRSRSNPQTAIGSDQPAPTVNGPINSNIQSQSSLGDRIVVTQFDNSQQLSPLQWAQQNKTKSFFDQRQDNYRSYSLAGKPAVSYSWCGTDRCGDNVVLPSRDGRRILVLSALYDYPGNAVRWDFQNLVGKLRLTQ